MSLQDYICGYTLENIIDIEYQDPQFLALKKARKHIDTNYKNPINQNLFLFMILQTSIVSYQIAGSGEQRREEVGIKLATDRKKLIELANDNIDRRYDFLTTSQNNKRIYNIKKQRLIKFNQILKNIDISDQTIRNKHHKDMYGLLKIISKTMEKPIDSKTLTFAIKMFAYGARIVFEETIIYPNNISIPIDSRLIKIYEIETNSKITKSSKDKILIKKYFDKLSKDHNIPALHLDSLLWIDYWRKYIK